MAVYLGLGIFHLGLGFEALAIEGTIGDRVFGLNGLAFGDFQIAHGRDGYGDRQSAGFSRRWLSCGRWRGLRALGDRGFGAEGGCTDQDSYNPGDD
jgi:hypothetical protein